MSAEEGFATIYRIVHIQSGKAYVGHTATDKKHRFARHRASLRKGSHHSKYMQNAWNKYGEHSFLFEIIEVCPEDQKLIREQWFIDNTESSFNYAKVAGSRKGCKQPPEEVERIRQMMMGNQYTKDRIIPEDEKKRRADANRGGKRTDEQRATMSKAMRGVAHPNSVGHVVSQETRAKIKAATDATRPTMHGKSHRPESKLKSSISNKLSKLIRFHNRSGNDLSVQLALVKTQLNSSSIQQMTSIIEIIHVNWAQGAEFILDHINGITENSLRCDPSD